MTSAEVGVGWVRLVPSMRGFARTAEKGLTTGLKQPSARAGQEAGDALALGIGDGVKRSQSRFRSMAAGIGDVFKASLKGAGVAAGAALVVGLQGAMRREADVDKLAAQLGGDPKFGAEMGRIAGDLYNDAFGDSIADTGDALRRVWELGLAGGEDATNEQLKAVTAQLLTFTDVMDADMERTTRAVSRMVESGIADSSEDAMNILTRGFQQGVNQADDLLDTFAEYSTQFRELGLSAEEATGLMRQGLAGGARDADVVADALKELAIRGQDGSEASATAFKLLGLNGSQMTAAFAAGGDSARTAMDTVLDRLKAIEDPVARNAAAVGLFGTKAEDLGDALDSLDLDTAADQLGDTEGAVDGLGSAYDNASTRIESFKRRALEKLTLFVGNHVIPLLERVAEVVGPILAKAWERFREALDRVDWTRFQEFGRFVVEDVVPRIITALGRLADFVVDDLFPAIARTVDFLSEKWEQHGPAVTGIAEDIVDGLGRLATFVEDTLLPKVRDAVDSMRAVWDAHGPDVFAAIDTVKEHATGFYNFLLDDVLPKVQNFARLMTEAWEEHGGDLRGVVDTIEEILNDAFEAANVEDLTLDDIFDYYEALWDEHGDQVKGWAREVVDKAKEGYEAAAPILGEAAQFLWDEFGVNYQLAFTRFKNRAIEAFEGWLLALRGSVTTLVGLALGDPGMVADGLKAAFGGAGQVVTSVISGFFGLIIDTAWLTAEIVVKSFGALFGFIIDKAVEFWEAHGDAITDAVKETWDLFLAFLDVWAGEFADKIGDILEDFTDQWLVGWLGIGDDTELAWDSIGTKITEGGEAAKGKFNDVMESVKDLATEKLGDLVGLYDKLPDDIKNALSDLRAKLLKPFKAAFQGVKDQWNNLLGGKTIGIPGLGVSYTIKRLHEGGIFDAGGGRREGLALLESGEGVFTREQMAALAPVGAGNTAAIAPDPVTVVIQGQNVEQGLIQWLRSAVRIEGGGNVQLALGAA